MSDESRIEKSAAEWKQQLNDDQYRVCREKGTEAPFSGKYYHHKETGKYLCACCGNELFGSEAKFDSGTGWPSFWQPVDDRALASEVDTSHGMRREEVMCSRCGAHLGHLFPDGPQPTGLRYCINSLSLDFRKE